MTVNEEAAEEAVRHLRAAALELIAAARAVLDLTEDMVNDPGPLLGLIAAVAAVARPAPPASASAPDQEPLTTRPRVEHIRVS
jgi:hypothetical protein